MFRPLLWVILGSFTLGAAGTVVYRSARIPEAHSPREAMAYAPRAMNQPLRNAFSALP